MGDNNTEGEAIVWDRVTKYFNEMVTSLLDDWDEFKDTFYDQWDLLVNDPVDFATQYWEMFVENWTKVMYFSIVLLAIFLFVRTDHSSIHNTAFARKRFMNMSSDIKVIVEDEQNIEPVTKMNFRRSLTHAARRLSGLDVSSNLKQPVVLLFAAQDQTQLRVLMEKFVADIDKYSETFVVEFNCDSMVDRMQFEKRVFGRLDAGNTKHRLLILNNIDRLFGTSPLVLHSLADNESSPFKDLVIVATITMSETPKELISSQECSELISNRLLEAWTSDELLQDQIYPIVSRLVAIPVCRK